MSELSEPLWSVLSERGCEASHLKYADAARMMRRLVGEKVYGLCIITDEAARRSGQDAKPNSETAAMKTVADAKPAQRRTSRRKIEKPAES